MNQYRNIADKNLVFAEYFNSEIETRKGGGIPTGTVTFSQGYAAFTTDGVISFSDPVYNVKSVRLVVDLDSTTEDILKLSSSHSIEASSGALTATGFSSPTLYVDGSATNVISTGKTEIIATTATGFTADDILVGYKSAYLEGKVYSLELYNKVLTSEEVANLYSGARYRDIQHNTSDHSLLLDISSHEGVIIEKSDQNTITDTDVEVFKEGDIRVMQFNGSSSHIASTLSDNVDTIVMWVKPKTATESIVDLGSSNTITISSDTLTAGWADDVYVNGTSANTVKHGEWNMIACRVDSSLALTAIEIGKVSTSYYEGMLDRIQFFTGKLSDAELSQIYTANKHRYF